ncbi:MAG TPA: hypothetical protein VF317_06540 [Dermatophilaceae bacterium]
MAIWGVAVGIGVNTLATDVGYRGAAGAAGVAAVLISAGWLHDLSKRLPRAPLVRIASRGLLAAAAVAAVLAIASPSQWQGYDTITAAALAIAATLIRTQLADAVTLLGGVAFIGVGVALVGDGMAVLADHHLLAGVALIGLGVAAIGVGAAFTANRALLGGVAGIGLGVAIIGGGVAVLADRLPPLLGVAVIFAGVGGIGLGVVVLHGVGAFARVRTSRSDWNDHGNARMGRPQLRRAAVAA